MEPALELALWILLGVLLWFLVGVRILRKVHPFPIPSFLTGLIDNPIRRGLIQKPDAIARAAGARPGMAVLELGPGKGSYTAAVARAVAPGGTVVAIDIAPAILARLAARIETGTLPANIEPRVASVHALPFPDDHFDIIFAVACLPEIPGKVEALAECHRVLKPGGILSLCELFLDPDYPLRSTEMKWATAAGFTLHETHGNFFTYQLNFIKEA